MTTGGNENTHVMSIILVFRKLQSFQNDSNKSIISSSLNYRDLYVPFSSVLCLYSAPFQSPFSGVSLLFKTASDSVPHGFVERRIQDRIIPNWAVL